MKLIIRLILLSLLAALTIGCGGKITNSNRIECNQIINFFENLSVSVNELPTNYFYDYIKLRDCKDTRVIAISEKILKEVKFNNIWAYAATQVLFNNNDSIKAQSILDKYKSKINFNLAYDYAFHWEKFNKTNEYIRDFLVEPNITEIKDIIYLRLTIDSKINDNIIFQVTLKNNSDTGILIYKPNVYLGDYIVISSDKKVFQKKIKTTRYKLGAVDKVLIKQGSEYSFLIPAEIKWGEKLDCEDMHHELNTKNKFYAYAVFNYNGILISKPITIKKHKK